uniref:Uncharacterized protein n=1 Tax=Ananas comosus var. bracteatus TaxID=296719 RepID=A0A6V7PL19_ANACO|nr:unnamed protein product [Ananas comosus var. bracteatus]
MMEVHETREESRRRGRRRGGSVCRNVNAKVLSANKALDIPLRASLLLFTISYSVRGTVASALCAWICRLALMMILYFCKMKAYFCSILMSSSKHYGKQRTYAFSTSAAISGSWCAASRPIWSWDPPAAWALSI